MEEDNKKSLEDRDSSIKINSDSLYSNISGRKIKESKRTTTRKRTFISTKWRWLILIFIGMIGFGMYFTQYNIDCALYANTKFKLKINIINLLALIFISIMIKLLANEVAMVLGN